MLPQDCQSSLRDLKEGGGGGRYIIYTQLWGCFVTLCRTVYVKHSYIQISCHYHHMNMSAYTMEVVVMVYSSIKPHNGTLTGINCVSQWLQCHSVSAGGLYCLVYSLSHTCVLTVAKKGLKTLYVVCFTWTPKNNMLSMAGSEVSCLFLRNPGSWKFSSVNQYVWRLQPCSASQNLKTKKSLLNIMKLIWIR